MMPAGLSFEQAPPISVPFRFFLTAPLFLFAAALLLALRGPEMVLSRHMPAALAATHLLTLGFTSMVMCGALMQMLPVVAGSPMPRPRRVAWLVHLPLTLGAALLAAAFLSGSAPLMHGAASLLSIGLAAFISAAAWSIIRSGSRSPSVPAMGLAVAALLATGALGISLAVTRHGGGMPAYGELASLHPLWGLYGWTTLLVFGVAYQVVPMFQLTPNYPHPLTRWLATGMFLLLILCTGSEFQSLPWLASLAEGGLAAGAAAFAIATLQLQTRRKRKINDATLLFWRVGMGLLLACCLLGPAVAFLPPELAEKAGVLLGILALPGFILAVINGMLYKIVPFLAWFHLQSRYAGRAPIPNMKQFQPDHTARLQLGLYLAALALLAAAVLFPPLAAIAGLLWALNALALGWNLARAASLYRRTARLATAKNPD